MRLQSVAIAALLVGFLWPHSSAVSAGEPGDAREFDIVVYGGTSAGVMAAVHAKRMEKHVALVCPDQHLGGLSSGGLGWTDTGDKSVIGGLSREFYHRVWKHYQSPAAWRWQSRSDYGNRGQGTRAIDGSARTMWIFEPHVAEQVFEELIAELNVPVHRGQWLDRGKGVVKKNGRIESITMLSGQTYRASVFIDASYEGDLMAAAGVDYHVGRESRSQYGEQWNGVQTGVRHHRHHFGVLERPIDPYVVPGDPSSGLLPRISDEPPGEYGAADKKVQAYCFRTCLTKHPENRVPFPKPEGYDPEQYQLLPRIFDAGWRETFAKFDPIPNLKTDTNNHGPFSTDNIGFNYEYPEASYERRREIIEEHRVYQQGLMYFIANDPRVPADVREEMSEWGLAKDEFVDNDHWPHQLYIREARRMSGRYVMTENEVLKRSPTPEPIGMGSYVMDSHNVQRYVTPDGRVQNEGDVGVRTKGPYQIALGAIQPRRDQCTNVLVPVCVSSSHIAFGSIRMEPVFMILGQSAATVAAMAVDRGSAVQDVPYNELRGRLLEDGQVLESSRKRKGGNAGVKELKGIVVDDVRAILTGDWSPSRSVGNWVGSGYIADSGNGDGKAEARIATTLPAPGRYEVRISFAAHPNRASNVPVSVEHAEGRKLIRVDQRKKPSADGLFLSLGEYQFDADGTAAVTITNRDADGHVTVDAVQWIPVGDD